MPLADDTSGALFENVYYIPGNPTVPNAPPVNQALGLDFIDASTLLDDFSGHGGRRVRPYGTVDSALHDAGIWFVDRFWIIPNPVDFGNILSDKLLTVTVLNAFRTQDFDLTDIDETALAAIDVAITAGPARPVPLRVQEQLSFTFTASFEGALSFDTFIDFTFDPVP